MAGLNIASATTSPQTLATGDVWLLTTDIHPLFHDNTSTTQKLAFFSDITTSNSNLLAGNNTWTGTNAFNGGLSASSISSGNISRTEERRVGKERRSRWSPCH